MNRSTSSHSRARSRALKCGDGGETVPGSSGQKGASPSWLVRWPWRAFAAPSWRPKPRGPDAPVAHQAGAFGGSAVPAEPTVRRCRGPLSGGGACPENVGAGLETQPTGGLAEQAYKHRARNAEGSGTP
jgi:hypothetical protein